MEGTAIHAAAAKIRSLLNEGRTAEVCSLLTELEDASAGLCREAAAWAFQLAWMQEQTGQANAETEHLYRQAAKLSPDASVRGNAFFRAGWLAQLRNDAGAAEPMYCRSREAMKGQPGETHAHASYWLAYILEGRNELLAALKLYEEALSEDSGLGVEALFRMFMCRCSLYDFANMEKLFSQMETYSVPKEKEERKAELLNLARPLMQDMKEAEEHA